MRGRQKERDREGENGGEAKSHESYIRVIHAYYVREYSVHRRHNTFYLFLRMEKKVDILPAVHNNFTSFYCFHTNFRWEKFIKWDVQKYEEIFWIYWRLHTLLWTSTRQCRHRDIVTNTHRRNNGGQRMFIRCVTNPDSATTGAHTRGTTYFVISNFHFFPCCCCFCMRNLMVARQLLLFLFMNNDWQDVGGQGVCVLFLEEKMKNWKLSTHVNIVICFTRASLFTFVRTPCDWMSDHTNIKRKRKKMENHTKLDRLSGNHLLVFVFHSFCLLFFFQIPTCRPAILLFWCLSARVFEIASTNCVGFGVSVLKRLTKNDFHPSRLKHTRIHTSVKENEFPFWSICEWVSMVSSHPYEVEVRGFIHSRHITRRERSNCVCVLGSLSPHFPYFRKVASNKLHNETKDCKSHHGKCTTKRIHFVLFRKVRRFFRLLLWPLRFSSFQQFYRFRWCQRIRILRETVAQSNVNSVFIPSNPIPFDGSYSQS